MTKHQSNINEAITSAPFSTNILRDVAVAFPVCVSGWFEVWVGLFIDITIADVETITKQNPRSFFHSTLNTLFLVKILEGILSFSAVKNEIPSRGINNNDTIVKHCVGGKLFSSVENHEAHHNGTKMYCWQYSFNTLALKMVSLRKDFSSRLSSLPGITYYNHEQFGCSSFDTVCKLQHFATFVCCLLLFSTKIHFMDRMGEVITAFFVTLHGQAQFTGSYSQKYFEMLLFVLTMRL